MPEIRIGDKTYSHAWLLDRQNDGAQAVLARAARSKTDLLCLCQKNSRRRNLYISHREHYTVARMPFTGLNHDPQCGFYGEAVEGMKRGNLVSKHEKPDGRTDIKLNCPLKRLEPAEPTQTPARKKSISARPSRSASSLLGLLLYMWEEAGLDTWHPRAASVDAQALASRITNVAQKIDIGRRCLADFLCMPSNDTTNLNREQIDNRTGAKDAALFIVEVRKLLDSKLVTGGKGLKVGGLEECIWMDPDLSARTLNSFEKEIAAIGREHLRVFAIGTLYRKNKTLGTDAVGLVRMTDHFIPVQSLHEAKVADKLVAERRSFRKPLTLGDAQEWPDFILMDTMPDQIMEVFGMDSDAYNRRKHAKLQRYQEQGIPLWQWDTKAQKDIPPFPPIAHGAQDAFRDATLTLGRMPKTRT